MKNVRFYLLVQCLWAIPVVTNRRQSGDMYTTLQQDKTDVRMCPVDNATGFSYLMEERQCISNHYLFNGNLNVEISVSQLLL